MCDPDTDANLGAMDANSGPKAESEPKSTNQCSLQAAFRFANALFIGRSSFDGCQITVVDNVGLGIAEYLRHASRTVNQ